MSPWCDWHDGDDCIRHGRTYEVPWLSTSSGRGKVPIPKASLVIETTTACNQGALEALQGSMKVLMDQYPD